MLDTSVFVGINTFLLPVDAWFGLLLRNSANRDKTVFVPV